MQWNETTNFKATALEEDTLRQRAPSIYATGPMTGVSSKYAFVPTARIVSGLRALDWVPVAVEEQRIRTEARRGFQKHLLRFRRAEQMQTLDEWNMELVLVNSHDAGCAYQLHAGLYRRICSNGLVIGGEEFESLRFRHAGLEAEVVVQASLRVVDYMPRVAAQVERFRARVLNGGELRQFAEQAVLLRYPSLEAAPVAADTLLKVRRPEDEGSSLWLAYNRAQEALVRGGVSDQRRDRHNRLRSVRALRGIDSKVDLNRALWGLAERFANGATTPATESVALAT